MIASDTIAAPITAPGHAAVSIVRVSGPAVREVVERFCVRAAQIANNPRHQIYSEVIDLLSGSVLDHALVTFFPGPNSFTGEDILEFALHGSPFIVGRLMENLSSAGVRFAKPGEFSERAFHNGKLDLSQAEAIADLIAAESEAQAQVAREQLEGKLSRAISDLGEPLRNLLAEIEAYIDFPEEGINPLTSSGWISALAETDTAIVTYLESYSSGKLYREGASVVLVGLPNAGKSSLLNRLVGENRVIVTPIAGTTRDSIEERVSLGGLSVRLWDTAGLAERAFSEHIPDEIEKLGIERSWKKAEQADLLLFVYDQSAPVIETTKLLKRIEELRRPTLVVANKIDLPAVENLATPFPQVAVSAETGLGIVELKEKIVQLLTHDKRRDSVLITTQRHRDALARALTELRSATAAIKDTHPPEFVAVYVRSALSALDEIIGVTTTEDILGKIFSKFCIGK